MRKLATSLLTTAVLGVSLCSLPATRLYAADSKPAKAPPSLKAGDVAPDFTLSYFDGNDLKKISLHDYHGKKNVLLGFYIFAFTGG